MLLKKYFENVVAPFVIVNHCQNDMNELNNDHLLIGASTVINKFKEATIDFVLRGSKGELCDNLLRTDQKR